MILQICSFKKCCLVLFLLRKNKTDSTVHFCPAFFISLRSPLVEAQDFNLFKVMSLASEKERTLKYSWIIFSKRLFLISKSILQPEISVIEFIKLIMSDSLIRFTVIFMISIFLKLATAVYLRNSFSVLKNRC